MNPRLARVTGQQLVRALEKAGYEQQRQRGSHVRLKRSSDGRRVTVPLHARRQIPIGTLRAILRDADITPQEFNKLL
jgi:predicted RNA binding protein YcfA (HicA-like mRNA interferase family)